MYKCLVLKKHKTLQINMLDTNYFKRNSSILPPNSPRYVPSNNNIKNNNKNNSKKDNNINNDNHSDNNNKFNNITVLWSIETIKTLKNLMNRINTHKLMQPIGHIVRHFIDKYQPYDNEYKIRSIHPISEMADRNILILAYICELYLKKIFDFDIVISDDLIYLSMGKIIYDISNDLFRYDSWELTYGEVFVINLLENALISNNNEHKNYRETITTAYYISKYIIKYIEQNPKYFDFVPTLVTRINEVDITILTKNQIKGCLEVLGTKRMLYLRLILVISEYMLHEKTELIIRHIFNLSNISNLSEFEDMLGDMIMEVVITIIGHKIKMGQN